MAAEVPRMQPGDRFDVVEYQLTGQRYIRWDRHGQYRYAKTAARTSRGALRVLKRAARGRYRDWRTSCDDRLYVPAWFQPTASGGEKEG